VETDVTEKVDISRVLIQRVAGAPAKARVTSLEAANAVLESWADDVAPESGHDECDFQIVFEDGFRYHGHYHLSKSQKRISLGRHVRKQLTAMAAKTRSRKSAQAGEEPAISMIGGDLAESAKIALDHYNI
jgi:hypothetical protein